MSTSLKEAATPISIALSKDFVEQFSREDKPKQNKILKVLKMLRDGEHSNGLNLEKLQGIHQDLWSCRVNDKERLILQRLHDGGWYVQEISDHKYETVQTQEINPHKTLSDIDSEVSSSSDCSDVKVSPAIFLKPHFFGEFTLTQEQGEVCSAHLPILLSGGAGSGKSLVLCRRAEDLLRTFSNEDDKVLLLTVPRLVGVVSEEWKSSKAYDRRLEICCYADLFGSQVEHDKIDEWLSCDEELAIPEFIKSPEMIKQQFDVISACIDQAEYFKRDGVSVAEKQSFWALFERYKQSPQSKDSVAHDKIEEWLSGDGKRLIPSFVKSRAIIKQEFDVISACDNQADYLKLGAKQSYVASEEEKKSLWALFDRYKGSRQSKVDLRYQSFDLEKKFTAVFVDESQIYSHAQLRNIRELCTGSNFIWAFDNSQNAFGSYSPEQFIRSMFYREQIFGLELSSSFRCPKQILEIANQVKNVQHYLVGNQSKKSSSEQSKVSEEHSGSVSYIEPNDEFQVVNNLHFAVFSTPKFRAEAKQKFPNCLVLLPGQAPGLEFDTVLLWRVLEDDGFVAIEKLYADQVSSTKSRSPIRSEKVEVWPLLSNLYVAITRTKSNLVICTEQSHIQKIRRLWAAFGLTEHPSIHLAKLPQPPEFAKENRTPNIQETSARIAELRRNDISEEDISRMVGTHSQQKTESVCAGGGASTLTMFKPSQSSSHLKLFTLSECESQKVHDESIAEVPVDIKMLIRMCFKVEKPHLGRFLQKMLEKCTSPEVWENVLKLNIDGQTMESFMMEDKDRCQSLMMMIHALDDTSFVKNHKYRVLRHWFNQNDALLNQLITLMLSDFRFYDGNLRKLISDKAPSSTKNLWQHFQNIKSKVLEYRGKSGDFPLSKFPTPLVFAMITNDLEMLKVLISMGVDKDADDIWGLTPIMAAITSKKDAVLRFLVGQGANKDKANHEGQTPIMVAIASKNNTALEFLVDKGADIDKTNHKGQTSIIVAIASQNYRALEYLAHKGAELNKESLKGNTPIGFAIQINNTAMLQLLLSRGADKDKANSQGVTPILSAIHQQRLEALELLIHAGADPNKSMNDGDTPILEAIALNNPEMLKLLLDAGADKDKADQRGGTPILATLAHENTEMLKLLLDTGANKDKANHAGQTPILEAIACEHIEALKLLLDAGADKDKANHAGQTPILKAMSKQTADTLALLINARANPNESCMDGSTPLMYALRENKIEHLKLLIQAKADVTQESLGTTPLEFALAQQNKAAIELLSATAPHQKL